MLTLEAHFHSNANELQNIYSISNEHTHNDHKTKLNINLVKQCECIADSHAIGTCIYLYYSKVCISIYISERYTGVLTQHFNRISFCTRRFLYIYRSGCIWINSFELFRWEICVHVHIRFLWTNCNVYILGGVCLWKCEYTHRRNKDESIRFDPNRNWI